VAIFGIAICTMVEKQIAMGCVALVLGGSGVQGRVAEGDVAGVDWEPVAENNLLGGLEEMAFNGVEELLACTVVIAGRAGAP